MISDKVFECTEHSADLNSSSAVSGLWPNTTQKSTDLLQEFSWGVVNHHPPYSSDLVPSDFHLFLHLKIFLSGQCQRFQNDREAEMSVTVVPISGGRLPRHGIQKLVPQYDKYLYSGVEYVKKIPQYLLYLFQ